MFNSKIRLALNLGHWLRRCKDCKIKNVIEIKSGELLQYWIECPKEKEKNYGYAFMTWIKNPSFQSLSRTRAFQEMQKSMFGALSAMTAKCCVMGSGNTKHTLSTTKKLNTERND
jgi:hypothetical protein